MSLTSTVRSSLGCTVYIGDVVLSSLAFGFCEYAMPSISKEGAAHPGTTKLYVKYETSVMCRSAIKRLDKCILRCLPLGAVITDKVAAFIDSAEERLNAFEEAISQDLKQFDDATSIKDKATEPTDVKPSESNTDDAISIKDKATVSTDVKPSESNTTPIYHMLPYVESPEEGSDSGETLYCETLLESPLLDLVEPKGFPQEVLDVISYDDQPKKTDCKYQPPKKTCHSCRPSRDLDDPSTPTGLWLLETLIQNGSLLTSLSNPSTEFPIDY
ncbi:hypothetical protein DSO57_1010280 [Entomophthora muscae]|uniref:Uncharacterized protein n=1 Tax=Entomophthora muscae TaxID=34485 RepID=A0ACC2T6S8_9FUNG|nr:hypothetical protein DSO57_1010280 [Entomophthora muscae]